MKIAFALLDRRINTALAQLLKHLFMFFARSDDRGFGVGRSGDIDRVRRLCNREELRTSVTSRDAGTVAVDRQLRAADVPVRVYRGDPERLGLCD